VAPTNAALLLTEVIAEAKDKYEPVLNTCFVDASYFLQ
jgi:hypothetical protein